MIFVLPTVLLAVPECLTCPQLLSAHRDSTGTKDGIQPDIPELLQGPSGSSALSPTLCTGSTIYYATQRWDRAGRVGYWGMIRPARRRDLDFLDRPDRRPSGFRPSDRLVRRSEA